MIYSCIFLNISVLSGADSGFSWGGGGIMCPHNDREAPKSPTAGVQGPLKGPIALGMFDALLCYLSLIYKHSDTKFD